LRHVSYGGGRMPLPVIEKALRLLPNVAFVNAYGLTETSSTISILSPQDHVESAGHDDPRIRRRLASVGRPVESVTVQIRGAADEALGVEQRGEIWVKGEQIAGEYEGQVTAAGTEWFATKDVGFLDADGYLYLEGRLDDVIVRGGENLSPGEIEDVVLVHPAVVDVAVVGVPDSEWGERIVAVVVARAGATLGLEEIQKWVAERLRSSRVPSELVLQDALPYTDTGKLNRRLVRGELAAR